MGSAIVPVNYSVAQLQKLDLFYQGPVKVGQGAAPSANPSPPAPDELTELPDWSVNTYNLDVSTAASLGFAIGSLDFSSKHQVLVFESSRSKDVNGDDNHVYRFGVALRAVILVDGLSTTDVLTLPVVAAKVQLQLATASAQLTVRGYKGDDIGGMLPHWQHFAVDEYSDFMKSVSDIQNKIMGNPAGISPELLATTAADPALPDPSTAVGMFYALDAIAHRRTLLRALEDLKSDEQRLAAAVKKVYAVRVGSDETGQPDQQAADSATQDLGGLHLDHGLFG